MLPDRLMKFADPHTVVGGVGQIALLDVMGDDQAVVQSARTSYGDSKSTHKWDAGVCTVCDLASEDLLWREASHCLKGDRALIRYLMRHRHSTPIESCEIKIWVKLPIFVERQWARHRTAGWNEMSARYMELPEDYYIPDPDVRPMAQAQGNKQGSEGDMPDQYANEWCQDLIESSRSEFEGYRNDIEEGMAKEIARLNLKLNTNTVKVWKIDLHNLLHFQGLRMDVHAQWEIRMFADYIAEIVKEWCPFVWEAFEDYQFYAHTFSRQEMMVIEAIVEHHRGNFWLDDQRWGQKNDTEREWWSELMDKCGIETKRERADLLRSFGVIE